MERLTRRKAIIIAGGVPVLAGLGAYGAREEQAGQSTERARFDRPAPGAARASIQQRHLPNVRLITHEGKRVRFYDDLVKNKKVVLARTPEIDTSSVLERWAAEHDAGPGWRFLTGKTADVERLRRAAGDDDGPPPGHDASMRLHLPQLGRALESQSGSRCEHGSRLGLPDAAGRPRRLITYDSTSHDWGPDPNRATCRQYHFPRAKPPNAMSPTSATITPIQTLQMTARTIPMMTRIPPIPIPALLPDLCADMFVSLSGD